MHIYLYDPLLKKPLKCCLYALVMIHLSCGNHLLLGPLLNTPCTQLDLMDVKDTAIQAVFSGYTRFHGDKLGIETNQIIHINPCIPLIV